MSKSVPFCFACNLTNRVERRCIVRREMLTSRRLKPFIHGKPCFLSRRRIHMKDKDEIFDDGFDLGMGEEAFPISYLLSLMSTWNDFMKDSF